VTTHATRDKRTNTTTDAAVHRATSKISNADLVAALTKVLGTKIVAFMVDVDTATISRWRSGATTKINPEKEQGLRAAYQAMRHIEPHDDQSTVRAWFIGMNPQLDDRSPVEHIHEGNLRAVLAAARAFVTGG